MSATGRYMSDLIRGRAGLSEPEPVEQVDVSVVPDFDGGPRQSAPVPLSMNARIRRAAGFGG
jgi:hypothetical protein